MEKKESFRCGKQSVKLPYPVYIHSSASVVGTKEGEGSLKDLFDMISNDDYFGMEMEEFVTAKLAEYVDEHIELFADIIA